jgi:hypothetical protein
MNEAVETLSQVWDGVVFGLGVLAVYLGAILTGTIIRSLGGAGGAGLTFMGKYARGWRAYLRGEENEIVNITLNMVVDNQLKFDTIVADRKVSEVWTNPYHLGLIRAAAKRTTHDNPVVMFQERVEMPTSWFGRLRRRIGKAVLGQMTRAEIVEGGRTRRVFLTRQEIYRATYAPLISLISERVSSDNAIDLAVGRPVEEFRFVIALTYEQLNNRRARHLRAMVLYEPMLVALSDDTPEVDHEEHKTRYRTLLSISRLYRKNPGRFGIVRIWRDRELDLPMVH